jgi:hypothetical protein
MGRISLCLGLVTLLAGACDDDDGPGPKKDSSADQQVQKDTGVDVAVDGPEGDAAGDGPAGDGPEGDGPTGDGPKGDGPQAGDGPKGEAILVDKGFTWPDYWFSDAMNPGNKVYCNGKLYQCANGQDDDGDKLIDAADPECTGPCDNSEGTLGLAIPGVNVDCKQDCYWDDDSGGGNDDCDWNHKCDPKNPGPSYKAACAYDANFTACKTVQSQTCLDFCLPITPNGCDCFGCCIIYVGGKPYSQGPIYLGSAPAAPNECTVKTPQHCAPCTQQVNCMNDCGPCELCLGKTIKDLPAYCFPGAKDAGPPDMWIYDAMQPDAPKPDMWIYDAMPPDVGTPDYGIVYPWICPPGVKACLTNNDCPASYYCITGCCYLSIS